MIFTNDNTAAVGHPADVYLNGVEQKHVIEASPSGHYVVKIVVDAEGNPFLIGRGEFATEREEGFVLVALQGGKRRG